MNAWLKTQLRAWVLTAAEKQVLAEKPRAAWRRLVLGKFLRPDQIAVMDAMEAPDRWQPDEPLTPAEAKGWGQVLSSPTGRKVDVCMINMAQQQAQLAVHSQPAEIHRMAGFAAGFRASWMLAKAISTMAGTDAGNSEEDAGTAAPTLEHLNP